MNIDNLLLELKEHEGFSGIPYNDSLGNQTIGFGTLLPLSKVEATVLLRMRLLNKEEELIIKEPRYLNLKDEVKEIILNMAYNIGVAGVMKFRKMWLALEDHDYEKASKEMLASKWHIQVPNRAEKLAGKMKKIKDLY